MLASMHNVELILHSTNGDRGNDSKMRFGWNGMTYISRMMSLQYGTSTSTVDSCCDKYGNRHDLPTSSPSGVVINGKWEVQMPRTGTQMSPTGPPNKYLASKGNINK